MLGPLQQDVLLVLLDGQPLALELGQILFDRIVELHLALVDQHHQRRRR